VSTSALIVVDMLNPYGHQDAGLLTASVERVIEPLRRLVERARERDDVRLLYVNDNYGDFTADRDDLVRRALDGERPDLVEPILPPKGSLFVQKVRHSAFYSSALDHLLRIKEVDTLILVGQVTEQCIFYSALDAYVRGFDIRVARDGVIPIDGDLGDAALRMMEVNMSAEIVTAAEALG
jgi:nicotinamidase-related amidase